MEKSREELMKEAELIDVVGGTPFADVVKNLLHCGKEGVNIKVVFNGKTYYSLQTEDEMYQTRAGMTKSEFEEYDKEMRSKLDDDWNNQPNAE